MMAICMTFVSMFFCGVDFIPNLKAKLISNSICFLLTFVLPNISHKWGKVVYTSLIQNSKSKYYSLFFFTTIKFLPNLGITKMIFLLAGHCFIGNNARTSLIIVNLFKGKVLMTNHMCFYLFKSIKTLTLIGIYLFSVKYLQVDCQNEQLELIVRVINIF